MLKKHSYALGLVWLVAIFVLPMPFLYTLSSGLPAIYNRMALPIMLGVIAYVWMLLAIYIGTKPKWLDRLIGLPHAYMLHGILSLAALVLAFFHKEGSPSSGLIKLTGDYAFNLFLGLALYSMVFMAGWLTSRVPFLERLKKRLERLFKHEISVWLHRLNLLATLLIFIHVQLIDYIVAIKPFMLLFWLASVGVAASYLWAKFKPKSEGIRARLVGNHAIAENIRELVIRLPEKANLQLRSGDYVFISFPHLKGMGEPHPFSLVNSPKTGDPLILAIRGDGDFTRALANIQQPTDVYVDGGFGLYQSVIDDNQAKELMIVGGGIGVVPLLSVVEGNPDLKTQFFYTVKEGSSFIYADKFREWDKRPQFTSHRQVGRFSDAYILEHLPEEKENLVVLLGGPISMGRHWQKIFKEAGLRSDQIYFEEFSW